MAQYLLLDKTRKVVNSVEWDGESEITLQDGVSGFVKYDGPFVVGSVWNGTTVVFAETDPDAET